MAAKLNKTLASWSIAVLTITLVVGCSNATRPSTPDNVTSNKQSKTNNKTSSQSITPSRQPTSGVQRSIKTPRGVVWNPKPETNNNGTPIPTLVTPFSLYLSPSNSKQLQTVSAEKLLTLPLKESTSAGQFYVYLGNYFYNDNWIVYTVSLINPGMAQPYSNQLRAVNLDNKKDILITSFQDAGGDFFSIASDNEWILYSQKRPGPGVSYEKQMALFNLNDGEKVAVGPSELNVIRADNTINYAKNGKMLVFHLQLDSTTVAFE